MKVYRLEIKVIDFDEVGPEEMKTILENNHYPNHCISPHVTKIESVDIGEWHDEHPLNKRNTAKQAFEELFKGHNVVENHPV